MQVGLQNPPGGFGEGPEGGVEKFCGEGRVLPGRGEAGEEDAEQEGFSAAGEKSEESGTGEGSG